MMLHLRLRSSLCSRLRLCVLVLGFILVLFAGHGMAEFRVVTPSTFEPNEISHQMALFGRPLYGSKLVAPLFAAPDSDATGCEPFGSIPELEARSGNFILLMERGGCHFVDKVRHAQAIGAVGAVIYDINTSRNKLPLMLGDETAGDVQIPSVLIHLDDAKHLKEVMKDQQVVLLMSWEVPHPDNRVEYSLYFASRDRTLHTFFKNFRIVVEALGTHALFTPHYEVYQGNEWGCGNWDEASSCHTLCLDGGSYCTYDPEHNATIGLSGRDVLDEDVRQMCLYEYTMAHANDHFSINQTLLFWDYVVAFNNECSVDSATPSQFNAECSKRILQSLTLSSEAIESIELCASSKSVAFFNEESKKGHEVGIVTYPRFTVNDLQHYGEISCDWPISLQSCSPLKMICTGFQDGTAPEACTSEFWMKQCYPPTSMDDCGDCHSRDSLFWNHRCKGCDGIINSNVTYDVCFVCGGNGSLDQCGRCLQAQDPTRDKSCLDCEGVLFGAAQVDACGICNGHGSFDACGLCFNATDPRRQNYDCKVDNDPDAVRAKVQLIGIKATQFTLPVADAFKKAIAGLVGINAENVYIKTVDNAAPSSSTKTTLIYFFISTHDTTARDAAAAKLQSTGASLELGIRLLTHLQEIPDDVATMNKVDISHVILQSVRIGDERVAFSLNFGHVVLGLVTVGSLGLLALVVIRRREAKIRHDIHQMFAKYTPLMAVDADEEEHAAFHNQHPMVVTS